jgi:superkiller protein 3
MPPRRAAFRPATLIAGLLMAALSLVVAIGCVDASQQGTSAQARRNVSAVDLYIEAVRAYRAGDDIAAIAALNEAVQKQPDMRMAHAMLGDLYRSKGDYAQASLHYESVSRLDPYTVKNHYNLGVTYQLLNRLQDAAGAYLRALRLEPKDVKSNMNLGTVYVALGKFDEAVFYLERATQLDDKNSQAWSNLGVALDARGSPVLAEAAYRKSLELEGMSPVTLQNLAANLVTQKKGAEAVAVMEEVLKTNRSAATVKRYGDALTAAGRFNEALAQYDTAMQLDPRMLSALNGKAECYLAMYKKGLELDDSQRLAAVKLWKRSLELNANQPRVQEQLNRWEKPSVFNR